MESQFDYKTYPPKIDFQKMNDLVPAVIQDVGNGNVLMQGYMNEEAYQKTLDDGFVWFYSRSRKNLWKKGETSGNLLEVKGIQTDCDNDAVLIQVKPYGNTCHTGRYSCFTSKPERFSFLYKLEKLIQDRKKEMPENSYTTALFKKGVNKIAQKVGEEAVELVIESKDNNKELFLNEAADLLYHLLVLLTQKGYTLEEAEEVLRERHVK